MTTPVLTPKLLSTLEELACTLAHRVGERILELRGQGVRIAATKLSESDVVTAADREAERLLLESLQTARPDDGVLGEEGTSVQGSSGITWVLDPIDGTVNYLYEQPAYAVSVAATVQSASGGATSDGRRAIAGAVYLPVFGELFSARDGGGTRLNGERIRIEREAPLANALVATGFGYTSERRAMQAEVLTRVLPRVRDIRRLGSAATDLCMVASGRLDAYYELGLRPWDFAAGVLIAREAGAAVLGLDANQLPGEEMLIAAPPTLATDLQSLLNSR